jgi:formin 2/Wiskott-Aldrich syndrome protein
LMMELRKKIITFRDIIDLPPFDGSLSINEVSIIFNTGSSVEAVRI